MWEYVLIYFVALLFTLKWPIDGWRRAGAFFPVFSVCFDIYFQVRLGLGNAELWIISL